MLLKKTTKNDNRIKIETNMDSNESVQRLTQKPKQENFYYTVVGA